jgi:hypothetical protein
MKIIITEEQYNRFVKSSPALQNAITKYLNQYIEGGQRKVAKKSRNYGNLREDWCVDGLETITSIYFFENGNFSGGNLIVSENLIKTIQSLFTVKESFVLHVIEESVKDGAISCLNYHSPDYPDYDAIERIVNEYFSDYIS